MGGLWGRLFHLCFRLVCFGECEKSDPFLGTVHKVRVRVGVREEKVSVCGSVPCLGGQ